MNPNQVPGGQSPGQQNPYDFITNPEQRPKQSFGGGDNFMKRILIVVGGAVIIMIVVGIVISVMTAGSQGPTEAMRDLAFQQQDIVFLSQDGLENSVDPANRSLSATTALSIKTDMNETAAYLDSVNAAINPKLLPTTLDQETAALLETARTSNRYDETYTELLRTSLIQYRTDIQSAYNSTGSETAKTVLETAFNNANLLIGDQVAAE